MLRGTVAHNCHGKTKNLAAKTKYLTAKPKISRQNHKPNGKNKIPHDKTKNLTAKPNTSQQKQNTSRQNRKPHGKNKNRTTKPKTSRQKQKTSRKPKYFTANQSYFVFAVRFLVLPWHLWATVEGSMSRGNISWIVLLLLPASVSAPQSPDTKPPPTLQTVNNNYGLCNILR